jgi:hypothetical protein
MGLASALVLLASLQAAGEATPVVLGPEPGPTLVLAEVTRPARYIGIPQSCVEPDESGEVPICLMEIYEAEVRTLRHWSGPDVPARFTVRFTAHSFHGVWRRGTRFILRLLPFEDAGRSGLFASYWDWEDTNGEFCNDDQAIAGMPAEIAAIYGRGHVRRIERDTDEWNAGVIRCVTGRERAPA